MNRRSICVVVLVANVAALIKAVYCKSGANKLVGPLLRALSNILSPYSRVVDPICIRTLPWAMCTQKNKNSPISNHYRYRHALLTRQDAHVVRHLRNILLFARQPLLQHCFPSQWSRSSHILSPSKIFTSGGIPWKRNIQQVNFYHHRCLLSTWHQELDRICCLQTCYSWIAPTIVSCSEIVRNLVRYHHQCNHIERLKRFNMWKISSISHKFFIAFLFCH